MPLVGSYALMTELVRGRGFDQIDGALLDLGFSSLQVEAEGYGFSFQRDEPLDMRFNPEEELPTAAHLVNTLSEEELSNLIFRYGEERRARAVARAIVRNRPINTTGALAGLLAQTLGQPPGRGRRIHPATRTFQALRIAVNEELENLDQGLRAAIDVLAPGGRLVVISYHSLEDRLVKNILARQAATCICPPGLPVCVCGHQPALRLVNRRVVRPGTAEVEANPRSRSGRMRVAEKLAEKADPA
jgi:16S rRNA (cytosine1402-N4)-methyltransferase